MRCNQIHFKYPTKVTHYYYILMWVKTKDMVRRILVYIDINIIIEVCMQQSLSCLTRQHRWLKWWPRFCSTELQSRQNSCLDLLQSVKHKGNINWFCCAKNKLNKTHFYRKELIFHRIHLLFTNDIMLFELFVLFGSISMAKVARSMLVVNLKFLPLAL